MKRLKISPLVTLAMTTQMIVSPFAHAINPLQAINMAGQMIQANQQNMASQQQAMANQQMVGQMTAPGRDKYFNTDSLSRIPGLMEYMAQNGINPATLTCPTLPTTLTEIRAEVCRIGITNDRGVAPQAQLAEMFSLYKTYGDVAKQYEAYRSNSNAEGQGFGVGCMKNALQTLSGFFAYRINELDKLTTNLEALNNQFREASKTDLDAISEATAVLDGNAELATDVTRPTPDLMNFGKRFDNPACKSMYAGDMINKIGQGRPGGLNQISKNMRDQFAAKPAGSKFSGESYVGAHAAVVEDINKMADKAAQQFQLNFTGIARADSQGGSNGFGEFLSSLQGSVSSSSGLAGQLKNDFFSDAQLNYSKQLNQITADRNTLKSELEAAGVSPDGALNLASNLNAKNFDNEVVILQNKIRNGCLQRSFEGAGFWDRIKKNIVDPDTSKFANKNAFNSLRERIEGIMTNPSTTPEAKVELLKNLEAAEGGRFMLNMQGSYQKTTVVNGKTVTSSVTPSRSAPSTFFSDVVQTCDAQFTTNKLGSSMTGATAITKLREINQQYKSLAANEANNIRSEIRRKLIECNNSNEANNQQAGSCSPERFNTSTPGFCANAAFTCANNMKSCSTQAQNFVTQIKKERSARVNTYKANAQKNKADIVRIFDTALAKYMKEGEMMRGLFGAGFSSPAGIKREVTGDKYISKFRDATSDSVDGPLLLEDPDKYVDMFKANIGLLKQEVSKQQDQIMGSGGRGGGLLAQHIDQTDRNYQTAKTKAEEISNACIAKHDDYVRQAEQMRQQQMAEMQKRQNELGERRQEVCELFNRAQSDANGACNEKIKNVVGVSAIYGQFRDDCRNNGFHQEAPNDRNSTNAIARATRICTQRGFDVTAETPATPAPAPATSSASAASSTSETAIRNLCSSFYSGRGCVSRTTRSTEEGQTNSDTAQDCTTKYAQIVEFDTMAQNGDSQSGPAAFPDAPAECMAGFNGDRSVPEGGSLMGQNPMNAFMNAMGTPQ